MSRKGNSLGFVSVLLFKKKKALPLKKGRLSFWNNLNLSELYQLGIYDACVFYKVDKTELGREIMNSITIGPTSWSVNMSWSFCGISLWVDC